MTEKIAYMLLTCCKEQSRFQTLVDVVDNLKGHPQFEKFNNDLIVFDNDSTFENTQNLLKETFSNVIIASKNYGYWNPIGWVAEHCERILQKKYEYIYLIESDQIHYDWHRLEGVENFLDTNRNYDSMRVREFFVDLAHLYDKERKHKDSRTWAWCTQRNPFSNERVSFRLIDEEKLIYDTNFTTLPPSVNRLSLVRNSFNHLKTLKHFIEPDFWRACYDQNPRVALLDGGICHAKLGYKQDVLSSHFSPKELFLSKGYVKCNESGALVIDDMEVTHVR